ncbi:uncharacterized protein LOC131006826 [Salvia miltiorrhiza]|uniref:uncharacterized protein LOC131006826 n=1 Tax=Salvia miltiorrhiza TaxID=226208 RepID=UPI0025AC750E|nr:uncharacterized protein LOC131006826 [Salvia miltiorrhiza]
MEGMERRIKRGGWRESVRVENEGVGEGIRSVGVRKGVLETQEEGVNVEKGDNSLLDLERDTNKESGDLRDFTGTPMWINADFLGSFYDALVIKCRLRICHAWLVGRDFNEILHDSENIVGNGLWNLEFLNCSMKALDFYGSDHRPVLCSFAPEESKLVRYGKGRFHFEDKWFLEKDFVPNFLCKWASLHSVVEARRRMDECIVFLENWVRKQFNKLGKRIAEMRKERLRKMKRLGGMHNGQEVIELSNRIERAVEAEACHWKQRARVNWLANGDQNTGAFHKQSSKRRKKNSIKGLKNKDGEWMEKEENKA